MGVEKLPAKQQCTGPSTGFEIFVRGVRTYSQDEFQSRLRERKSPCALLRHFFPANENDSRAPRLRQGVVGDVWVNLDSPATTNAFGARFRVECFVWLFPGGTGYSTGCHVGKDCE